MAYTQHDCFGIAGAPPTSGNRRDSALAVTSLERQVIAFAAREPLSSLSTGKRPIARALFGVEPARALADPRLEALRRFVVLHRHGRRGAAAAGEILIGLGFARRELDDVRARIEVRRSRLVPAFLGLIPIALLIVGVVALIAKYLDDLLPATVIAMAICVPLVFNLHTLLVPSKRPCRQAAV